MLQELVYMGAADPDDKSARGTGSMIKIRYQSAGYHEPGLLPALIGLETIQFFIGDDASYPTPGIFHIALVTRNDVDMQVMDGLACGCSDIDTDIVTIGVILFVTDLFGPGNKSPEVHQFFIVDIEITGKMTIGNDQEMPLAGRMAIPGSEAILTLDNQAPARLVYTKTALFIY
jgi:hypothetical protein